MPIVCVCVLPNSKCQSEKNGLTFRTFFKIEHALDPLNEPKIAKAQAKMRMICESEVKQKVSEFFFFFILSCRLGKKRWLNAKNMPKTR